MASPETQPQLTEEDLFERKRQRWERRRRHRRHFIHKWRRPVGQAIAFAVAMLIILYIWKLITKS